MLKQTLALVGLTLSSPEGGDKIRLRHLKLQLAVFVFGAALSTASVGSMLNSEPGNMQIFFPNLSTPATAEQPFTVQAGNEVTNLFFGNIFWTLDISDTDLLLTMDDQGCCTQSVDFGGPVITFSDPEFPGLSGLSFVSTTIDGFNHALRISNNSNQIFIDVSGGLDLRDNRELRLSVEVLSAVVPIPAAAWLFGSALIGLVGIKRKAK
jgi:hypothetical protein